MSGFVTVSIGSGVVDSMFGKSQFPIKSYLEKRGEALEQASLLPNLFRMENSKHWAERYTGETAMDDFEPVGEGGSFPSNGFMESYSQTVEHMVWKSMFSVTREMADDNNLGSMKQKASAFITAYNRTREKFGRQLYVGGLKGTTVKIGNKTFKCAAADGKALFAKDHPAKVKGDAQSNLFAGDFTAANLGLLETRMQNTVGDNGELLNIAPDTIWIPNDGVLKDKAFAAVGSDKNPTDSTNAYNQQYGRWNILVDPYLTEALERAGITDKPWFLLDSKILADMDGAIFQDRVKLIVRSVLDDNNDNNLWKGRGRFAAGFADWRFVAVGGMTGGSAL